MPARDQRNVLRRATGPTRPPAIGDGRGRDPARRSFSRCVRGDQPGLLSGPWHRPPITATKAGRSGTVNSWVGIGLNPRGTDWPRPFGCNKLRLWTRGLSASSKQPCPRRLQTPRSGSKSAPNTATYCHFLAAICGVETTQEVAGSVADGIPKCAFLDGNGPAMHNLMFATAGWKVAKPRGLRDQGAGPLPEPPRNRTPGSRGGSASGWPGGYRGRRCFRGQEGDRLLLRDACDNEKCGRRALTDEGWRLGEIAAQSPRQGRAMERLNGSSTVSSTNTNIRVQSALDCPMAASADAPLWWSERAPVHGHF